MVPAEMMQEQVGSINFQNLVLMVHVFELCIYWGVIIVNTYLYVIFNT